MLDAVGDPVRRRIVERLAAGPLPVGEIARRMPVGRPAVSMHLRRLLAAGVVTARRSGNRRLYQLDPSAMRELQEHFHRYWEQAMAAFKESAEEEARRLMEVEQEEVRTVNTVTVRAPLEVAFRVFVGLRWWPVATHHLAEPAGEEAVLEPFVGGRWYERGPGDREQDWGTVLAWEPPHRVLLSWQL
ncbi:MAG: metalloregulator ArsR/SmtB family transcription factor, partial [Candidatus Dormibacteraeota bacterium]|nr:metalloregulator ArsR/SmtB family transcription factor [Candidatus Dormibacteraeota bacterium]